MKETKVWLVGAGPGDPGLFTLKGRAVLEQAEVVVYDKLVGQGVISMIPETAKKIYVGKTSGDHPVPQHEINRILLEEAQKGRRVVRLKGGDPFVFGRGGEELELLVEKGIAFEIVPGITSAVAVPAYGGIPVTHRDFTSSFHVITGHKKNKEDEPIDYEALVRLQGTLMFLMGVEALPKIVEGLRKGGMDPNMPVALIQNGTRANQRKAVGTLETIVEDVKRENIKTPAIIVVGKVVSLSENFAWAEKRALGGIKVGITRPADRASGLAKSVEMLGGEVVMMPAIKNEPILNNPAFDKAVDEISKYQWLAFTSPKGVEVFFDRIYKCKIDLRSLAGIKVAAVGSATKKSIEKRGILVDLVPEIFTGLELGKALAATMSREESLLLPRAEMGGNEIIMELQKAGIKYDDIPTYTTICPKGVKAYDETIDVVCFTSASTVKAFISNNEGMDFSKVNALCIGTETEKAAKAINMNTFISKEASIKSMVDALKDWAKQR